jgi:hypothetical protein
MGMNATTAVGDRLSTATVVATGPVTMKASRNLSATETGKATGDPTAATIAKAMRGQRAAIKVTLINNLSPKLRQAGPLCRRQFLQRHPQLLLHRGPDRAAGRRSISAERDRVRAQQRAWRDS